MIIIIVLVFDYVEKVDDFTELHAPWSAVAFYNMAADPMIDITYREVSLS